MLSLLRDGVFQALKLMGSDEQDREFGGEVSLESTVYWWHEKYKPRKPKYFNRVHTGNEKHSLSGREIIYPTPLLFLSLPPLSNMPIPNSF